MNETKSSSPPPSFFRLWCETRNWKAILAIVPPLLLLFTLAGFVIAGMLRSKESLKTWYRNEAGKVLGIDLNDIESLKKSGPVKELTPEEMAKVDLLFKRLIQLEEDNPNGRFLIALYYLQQGKPDLGRSMMEGLAPPDRKGYDLAHEWLAEDLFRRSVAGQQVPAEMIKHHLSSILSEPRGQYSPALYGVYISMLEKENKLEEAAQVLHKAAAIDPKMELEPIVFYGRKGLMNQALVTSNALVDKLTSQLESNKLSPEQSVEAYARLARAHQLVNRIDPSIDVLKKGISKYPEARILKRSLSDSYRFLFRTAMAAPKKNIRMAIDLLNTAVGADPTNVAVQSELAMLTNLGVTASEKNRVELIKLLAKGGSSQVIRLLLAESALGRGDIPSATTDYELILTETPEMTLALNNLAMIYLQSSPPLAEKSLSLIQKAVALSPEVAEFWDSKGDVEQKSNLNKEATQSYLNALQLAADRSKTRTKLIALYETMGESEEAAKQKELLAHIENRVKELKESTKNSPTEKGPIDEAAKGQVPAAIAAP